MWYEWQQAQPTEAMGDGRLDRISHGESVHHVNKTATPSDGTLKGKVRKLPASRGTDEAGHDPERRFKARKSHDLIDLMGCDLFQSREAKCLTVVRKMNGSEHSTQGREADGRVLTVRDPEDPSDRRSCRQTQAFQREHGVGSAELPQGLETALELGETRSWAHVTEATR